MLHALILFTVFFIVQSNRCVQRSFGPDAIVCVCNSTYCDGIYEPELQTGQFQLYTSTKSGKRLQFTVENFSTEPQKINGTLLIVNSSQQYQEIYGFGGTFTDATVLNIKSLSNKTQQKLLESYFSSGDTGIGYTYVNFPIASTDFSTRPYTYDDTPGDVTLSNFSLVEEDNYKIEYLHQIKSIMSDAELRIFCNSWSAPPWMKTSNSILWGSLKPEYNQTYANYIRKFFDAYKERGINMWGLITAHEPTIGSTPVNYNAMEWSPNSSAFWVVNYVAPTLSKAGYVPVYIAYDDERENLQWYVDDMFSNEEANKLYAGISVHWFEDVTVSPMVLTETHNKYPNKFIMQTEASAGERDVEPDVGIELGSWTRGEDFIWDIIENLSHWLVGWVHHNMALNESGGPSWTNNTADAPIIVIPENDEFYKQPMYYAMAHISNFVPRFSHRISLTGSEDNYNISTIAFLTPEKKIVVIMLNKGDEPVNVTIKDNNAVNKINLHLSANSFNTLLYLAHQ